MKKILFTLAATSLLIFGACKKDEDKKEDEDKTVFVEPTLDKNLLTNTGKKWEPQTGNPKFEFKANGVLGFNGSWKWLNNSDSMEIKLISSSQPLIYYFKYCQGDSMEAKNGSSGTYAKYRDHDW